MTYIKLIIGMAAALLVSAHLALAQDATLSPSDIPRAAMERLASLEGHWSSVTRYSSDKGQSWSEGPLQRVKFERRQKSLMIAEIPLTTDLPGFHLESFFTYDQYRGLYRVAVIDDTWGIMDIYEGTFEGDRLVLTNLRAATGFPMEGGVRHFRLIYEFHDMERTVTIDASDDGGESWFPNFVVTFQREDLHGITGR